MTRFISSLKERFSPALRNLGELSAILKSSSILVACTVALLILSLGQYLATNRAVDDLVTEVDQRVNLDSAKRYVPLVEPFIEKEVDCDGLRPVLAEAEAASGRFHLYLVDEHRKVQCSTKEASRVLQDFVRIPFVRRLVALRERAVPLLLEDPRTAPQVKPFSAAQLIRHYREWHLVLILNRHEAFRPARSYPEVRPLERYNFILVVVSGIGLIFTLIYGATRWKARSLEREAKRKEAVEEVTRHRGREELHLLSKEVDSMSKALLKQVKQLRLQEDEKRTFLAGLSHDLRSPLTAIRGYVDALMAEGRDLCGASARQSFEIVHRNTEHVSSLVGHMLDLEKYGRLDEAMSLTTFSIQECVKEVCLSLVPIGRAKGIDTVLDIDSGDDSDSTIRGDPAFIRRALSNVTANAFQYTPPGGVVTIALRRDKRRVVIEISDTGPGIPADEVPLIFDLFFRGASTRKEKKGNAGMGLYIVKKIMEAHAGEVRVRSTLGEGTKFELELPLV